MLGERIRELRKRKKMTLRELAAELGIPFTTLGNYERGDRNPDLGIVLEIANYFEVSMDYLTKRDNIANYDEYKVNSYTEDINKMLSKADPDVREQLLKIHDQIFVLTCEHAVSKPDNKELDQLQQIFNIIIKMKNSFGMGIKKGGFSPSEKYELLKLFLKEKQEIDKSFSELFEIYIERSIK
ncbi:helix-turn-helix domain-containing protein [Peribacillus simplex]|uniref:helix-turn-helix domain-containing protein n=1 Tax=Peribacillus simplex TaxID=1478 RepID=UPI0034E8867D